MSRPDAFPWRPGPTRFSPSDLAPGRVHEGRGFAMPLDEAWGTWRGVPEPKAIGRAAPVEAGTVVTGGAGFLGRHLVAALLRDPRRGPVTVASRDPSGLDAALAPIVGVGAVAAHRAAGRLRSVSVDLSRPGAADALAAGVEGPVGAVHHLAAAVDAFAGRGRLAGANVAAAGAAAGAARRLGAVLVHASTLSVFVSSNGTGEGREDWLGDDPGTVLYGGYAQTKAEAEAVLAREAADGLPTKVVRYGLLVPSEGRDLPADHFLRTVLARLSAVGAVPEPGAAEESFVDLTRVDQAAAAAVAIADAPREGVFHYANPRPCSSGDLVRALAAAMAREGRALRSVDAQAWAGILGREASLAECLLASAFGKSAFLAGRARRAPVLNADLFQATGRRFGIARSLACGAPVPEAPGPLAARLAAPFGAAPPA